MTRRDDLGGDAFKKRFNNNLRRSIILAKGGKYWVYEYLFAKKNRANIENDELLAFRMLANSYVGLTEQQVSRLLVNGDFVEICHDDKNRNSKVMPLLQSMPLLLHRKRSAPLTKPRYASLMRLAWLCLQL